MVSKEKTLVLKNPLFRSYYCQGCKQRKTCGSLTRHTDYQNYCCFCYYEGEKEKSQQYANYQQVYQRKLQDQQTRIQQLLLLKHYQGCSQCGSKEVDAYELYENSRLVCQPCLARKTGGSSSPISFLEQSRWYKKRWGINLGEWLDNYHCLPVNAKCAKQWLKNKQHLNNCACLELEAKEIYELLANSLKEVETKIKKCACETSTKTRTPYYSSHYGYTYCENCDSRIKGAGKTGKIKNRNDPQFWGLKTQAKVLCGECLKNLVEQMPSAKKYTFNKYLKRGYWGKRH